MPPDIRYIWQGLEDQGCRATSELPTACLKLVSAQRHGVFSDKILPLLDEHAESAS